jgi:hypothetical protein
VANQQSLQSTHTGIIPIEGIPGEAAVAHTFDNLQHILLGVSALTKAGCTVLFEQDVATIQCPGATPIKCPANGGLWCLPMQQTHKTYDKPLMALATIGNSNHPADLVAFHHAALFSLSLSTLEAAIQKQYIPPLPGLTLTTLHRYKPDLEATAMGHMDARRKNTQSTKPKARSE